MVIRHAPLLLTHPPIPSCPITSFSRHDPCITSSIHPHSDDNNPESAWLSRRMSLLVLLHGSYLYISLARPPPMCSAPSPPTRHPRTGPPLCPCQRPLPAATESYSYTLSLLLPRTYYRENPPSPLPPLPSQLHKHHRARVQRQTARNKKRPRPSPTILISTTVLLTRFTSHLKPK